MNSIAEKFAQHAEASDDLRTVTLRRLSPEQRLAYDIFIIGSEADEVIQNLNVVMGDVDRLGENPHAFFDRNPFHRFKLLVRIFYYEYGRFEDVFGYFTHWKQQQGLLTKGQRKAERDGFYRIFEPAIRTRNVMLHDGVSWEQQCSVEIGLLQALESIGESAIDKAGKPLTWDAQMSPLCARTLPVMLAMAEHMQVFWNMEMAHLALALVEKGRFRKAIKPYVGPHAAKFLRTNPNYC